MNRRNFFKAAATLAGLMVAPRSPAKAPTLARKAILDLGPPLHPNCRCMVLGATVTIDRTDGIHTTMHTEKGEFEIVSLWESDA